MRFSMDEALRIKRASRVAITATPIAEKLRILERLRERDRAIRRATIAPEQRPTRDAAS
ncbi:hypothetical protein [Gemmatimonas sp.]|uniref:hypothetical protein n=1 Tax=Gemmatimonas sp. TaxID=1962908 RepID=UPI0039837A73